MQGEQTLAVPKPKKSGFRRILRNKLIRRVTVLVLAAIFVPYVLAFLAACGLIDILRNKKRTREMFRTYFLGNGEFTWLCSPFNLLLDLMSLPYWNKGIMTLDDFPKRYRDELESLLARIDAENLVEKIESALSGEGREMIFFKWYRQNIETPIQVPAFAEDYKYIATIGVSVFNKRRSTSSHFGPFRPSYRVLYNINRIKSPDAFIEVGHVQNRWCEHPLFIFDDTLYHRSVNETDERRYCAFIDIARPCLLPWAINGIISVIGVVFLRLNHIFYKNWTFIK